MNLVEFYSQSRKRLNRFALLIGGSFHLHRLIRFFLFDKAILTRLVVNDGRADHYKEELD